MPSWLSASLSTALENARRGGRLSDERARAVRAIVESVGHVDYVRDAEAFAYLYFAANFAKAQQAILRLYRPSLSRPIRVLDLGCGAGPALFAASDTLRSGSEPGTNLHLAGVDVVTQQLELLNNLAAPLLSEHGHKVRVETILSDAVTFLEQTKGSWDLIVVSYLLVELAPRKRRVLQAALEARARAGTQVIVIDRGEAGTGTRYSRLQGTPQAFQYPPEGLDVHFLESIGLRTLPKSTKRDRFHVPA